MWEWDLMQPMRFTSQASMFQTKATPTKFQRFLSNMTKTPMYWYELSIKKEVKIHLIKKKK